MLINIVAHLTSRHHNDYNHGFIVSYIILWQQSTLLTVILNTEPKTVPQQKTYL